MLAQLNDSLDKVSQWVEDREYRAYDPGDGQMSPLRALTFGNVALERVLTASVLRVPFHIRPVLGIPPHTSTKGMGYMAWGYLRRFRLSGQRAFADRAIKCLDWLVQHRAPGYSEFCWGNHFTFTTRAGRIARGEPTIVWSGLIGEAFMEAHEVLQVPRYLEVASSVCNWILRVPREETTSGDCLSYVSFKQSSIHNSNVLGAALLARVAGATGRAELFEVATRAMQYTCTRQNPDGAWFYGEEPRYHWIDNFHTGYVLDSLKRYQVSTGSHEFDPNLTRGLAYFKRNFFEPSGCPKYYHNAKYPVDIQCAAQAIDTLAFFSDIDSDCLDLASKVARWTIQYMQDSDGHFYYRDLGWKKVKTPMFHWGQATMFKALAHLALKLDSASSSRTPPIISTT
jgi:hypothetical protein